MLYLTELLWTLLSWVAPSWAILPSHICCTLLINATPLELCCNLLRAFSATIQHLGYAVPYWTTLHPFELCCILLSYYEPSGLRYTLLSQAELLCTLLNYVYAAPSKLCCTLTELPPFIKFFRMPECRAFWHPIIPVPEMKRVPMPNQSGTEIRRSSPVLECLGTELRRWIPECQCRLTLGPWPRLLPPIAQSAMLLTVHVKIFFAFNKSHLGYP